MDRNSPSASNTPIYVTAAIVDQNATDQSHVHSPPDADSRPDDLLSQFPILDPNYMWHPDEQSPTDARDRLELRVPALTPDETATLQRICQHTSHTLQLPGGNLETSDFLDLLRPETLQASVVNMLFKLGPRRGHV